MPNILQRRFVYKNVNHRTEGRNKLGGGMKPNSTRGMVKIMAYLFMWSLKTTF